MSSVSLIGLDDGEQLLLSGQVSSDEDSIFVRRLSGNQMNEAVRLMEGASPVFAPSGHIVYRPEIATTALRAVPFSPEDMQTTGEPFPVAQSGSEASVSEDGTLVYLDNPFTGRGRIVWVDRAGETVGQAGKEQFWIVNPVVSPDGERVLVSGGRGRESDLWVHESNRPVLSRITFDDLEESEAVWSPDGRQIAFMHRGTNDLHVLSLDGSDAPTTIFRGRTATTTCSTGRRTAATSCCRSGTRWGLDDAKTASRQPPHDRRERRDWAGRRD